MAPNQKRTLLASRKLQPINGRAPPTACIARVSMRLSRRSRNEALHRRDLSCLDVHFVHENAANPQRQSWCCLRDRGTAATASIAPIITANVLENTQRQDRTTPLTRDREVSQYAQHGIPPTEWLVCDPQFSMKFIPSLSHGSSNFGRSFRHGGSWCGQQHCWVNQSCGCSRIQNFQILLTCQRGTLGYQGSFNGDSESLWSFKQPEIIGYMS
jgi:hypothetical protein